MYFNVRISYKIFYCIILICISFTVYVFIFSPRGFITLDSKKNIIENKKNKLDELNHRKIQISKNIERLKTDKEYILSYAKTFGYLDESKNERIIKILKYENSDKDITTDKKVVNNYDNSSLNYINIRGALIVALMILLCFGFYIILINKNLFKLKNKKIV